MSKTGRSMGRGTVVESGYVRRLGIIAIICTTLVSAGYSAVPRLLNYQGKLSDGSGNPVNGTKNVVFAIYDVPSGGVALWSETAASVTVTNGLFSVILGSVTPLTLPFDTDYYLGIKVGSDPEMSPRLRLTSAAYALNSDAVDGKHASDMVTRIIQGSNITISPASGVGDVTVNASGGGGTPGNTATSVGTSTSGGASSNYSREDHAHNLGANVVLTGNIVDGTIGNGDLANGAVTDTKVTSVGWGKLTGVPAGFADGVDDTGGGGTPASTVTNVAGSQVVGTSGNYAREDHVHSVGLGVVTSAHILDGTVANADMANGAVTDVKVTSVGWGKLTGIPAGFADGVDDTGVGTPASSVTGVQSTSLVGTSLNYARQDHVHDILDGSVTSADILDGTVANADISPTAAIAASKLNTSGATNMVTQVTAGSGVTLNPASGVGVVQIIATGGTGDITDVLTPVGSGLNGGASSGSVSLGITALGVTNGMLAANAVDGGKIADGSVASADIADGTISNVDIAPAAAIAASKINTAGATNMVTQVTAGAGIAVSGATGAVTISAVGGGGGDVTDVLQGAGITVTNQAGPQPSVAVTALGITNAMLAADAVTSAKITDGTVSGVDLAWPLIRGMNLGVAMLDLTNDSGLCALFKNSISNPALRVSQGSAVFDDNVTLGSSFSDALAVNATSTFSSAITLNCNLTQNAGYTDTFKGVNIFTTQPQFQAGIRFPTNGGRIIDLYSDTPTWLWFNTRNIAGSGSVDHQFVPYTGNYGLLGSTTNWWYFVYAYRYYSKVADVVGFDIYEDDLAVADSLRLVKRKDEKTGEEREVYDPDSIPKELKDATGQFINMNALNGFLLSCVRKAHGKLKAQERKIENQEKRIEGLMRRLEALELRAGTVSGR